MVPDPGTGKVVQMTRLDSVERAVADIAAGKAVVVIDDEDRENEGDLIFAAEKATPELVAFMVRYTSGVICVGLPGERCDALRLPLLDLADIHPFVCASHKGRGAPPAPTQVSPRPYRVWPLSRPSLIREP